MIKFKPLYDRRRFLLEQIGKAADEIKKIDERIASLETPTLKRFH
jgi:hypothetical protein